jgi:hypothetical protein
MHEGIDTDWRANVMMQARERLQLRLPRAGMALPVTGLF